MRVFVYARARLCLDANEPDVSFNGGLLDALCIHTIFLSKYVHKHLRTQYLSSSPHIFQLGTHHISTQTPQHGQENGTNTVILNSALFLFVNYLAWVPADGKHRYCLKFRNIIHPAQ